MHSDEHGGQYFTHNDLKAMVAAAVAFALQNVCCATHDWRPARAGDFTTPHQTCRNCRKDRPTPMSTGPSDENG